ncbi:MAG: histidine kinase [Chitinophagaceae bacterium]
MDNSEEGFLLIGTTMIILVAVAVAFLFIMIIYRKRKLEHVREVEMMKERFQKEMLETQVEIQRNTMAQIGREIHDNVGQKLTLAALYTEHLKLLSTGGQPSETITSITNLLGESLADLRQLSKDLTQSLGEVRAFTILLEREVKKVNEAGICKVQITGEGETSEFPLSVNTMLLRIVQEFFHNSIRHAQCRNITVKSVFHTNGFLLMIADDGIGFETRENGYSGIGLNNMKKRAALIGAEFSLTSSPGEGTRMGLFLPAEKS